MRYIGRYKEGVDFQDLVTKYPILSNVTHLQYVYMFIIETDDPQVLNQLRSDNDILYVQEDRFVQGTDIIEGKLLSKMPYLRRANKMNCSI